MQDEALKLSSMLIKGVADGQRVPLLQRCADLRVLGGFDCRQGRRVPILKQRRERFDLGLVQTPNADPDQQGGGISAAASSRRLWL